MNWEAFFSVWLAAGLVAVPIGCIFGLACLCAWVTRRFGEGCAIAVMAAGIVLGFSVVAGLFT